ncbi:MAG: Sua5/YciO/YrdC/YwlC family protein [Clostridia bacterium]|nr:Sua5/YciO/YrdC/YwlC family protein [Clostridia bacterium]
MQVFEKEEKEKIIKAINNDELIVLKTDTVFGIMARASSENEKRVNEFKKSQTNKKISVIFPDIKYLNKYLVEVNEEKKKLIEGKLPGRYTFIVNLKNFSDFQREDFGVRVTKNEYLQEIIKEVGPLLATSVNITGEEPLHDIKEIIEKFKNTDLVVVRDTIEHNKPSTIIDIRDEIKILRN